MNLKQFILSKSLAVKQLLYRKLYVPYRAATLRRKERINVVFVVMSLGAWKSEMLYREMLAHPRFNPLLLISKNHEDNEMDKLRQYALSKGYDYVEEENCYAPLYEKYSPDIIFYQKPYGTEYLNNLRSLFCYVPYAFHGSTEVWSINTNYICNCWQVYYENSALAEEYSRLLGRNIHNSYGTGIPTMDELMTPKEEVDDPWKGDKSKKRIIFAPHHSINPENWWQTSTFLETGEKILEMAEKYSDKVQWAFKPHPLLRGKLEKIWGKAKTDDYYHRWTNAEWSQYESGKYLGLFKHSDAMIHDCGSFIEEYHYTGNPVMYLLRKESNPSDITANFNSIIKSALELHTFGHDIREIEQFIQNVITGTDTGREDRLHFYNENLVPPLGQSASKNIIDAILGQSIMYYQS